MCRLLSVSKSSFHAWLRKGGLVVSARQSELEASIKRVFLNSKKRYGSPRVWRILRSEGFAISKALVERLMRELGLQAKQKRRFKSTTDSNHNNPVAPNLLDRNFDVRVVNRVWLSDITYLRMARGGFAYLCVVMDLASKQIIGWAVEEHMETSLVLDALKNAIMSTDFAPNELMFHSDQGSQYASEAFTSLLKMYGIVQSMSRKGQCWDNAPMESFFGSLKMEWEDDYPPFEVLDDARAALFEYIEIFYNRIRLHSSIGYLAPICYVGSESEVCGDLT